MKNTNNEKSGFLVQGGILALASILVRVIGLIYRIPLTRILGDEGMSFYSTAFEIYNIALLLSSYSLPLAVSKLVATRLATGEKKNAHNVFKCAFVFALVVGAIIGVIVYAGANVLAGTVMHSYLSYIALKVLAPGLFIVALLGVLRGYFQGYGTMVPTAISQILEQILNAIVSIVAASYLYNYGKQIAEAAQEGADKDLWPAAYGAAGGTLGTVSGAALALVFLVIAFVVFYHKHNKTFVNEPGTKNETTFNIFPILLKTIIPVIFSSVIYNICNILDQGVYNFTMDFQGVPYREYAKLLGMYTAKFLVLVNIPLAIANALGASSIPSLSTSLALGQREKVQDKIGLAIKTTMLIAIPSFMGYLFLASPILQLLFGDSRLKPAHIVMVGSVMVLFYSLSTVTNAILQGLDKMSYPIKNALISLLIHLVILFVLLFGFKLNIYAVAIASCIFSFSMCILNQKDIHKICGYRQEIKNTFIKPLVAALVMGVVARLVYDLLIGLTGNLISTVLSICVGFIIYLVLMIKLGSLDEDNLRDLPKGGALVALLKKMHLM